MAGTPTRPTGIYELTWEKAEERANLLPNASPEFVPTAPPGWAREYVPNLRHPNGEPQVRVATANDPVHSGSYAVRFELHKTDTLPGNSKSPRAELSAAEDPATYPKEPFEPFGVERWYGFSIYLPVSWSQDAASDIVTQWHQDWREPSGSSPPLSIGTHDGQWEISQHWKEPNLPLHSEIVQIGPYETDRWTDWVVHVKWSGDATANSDGVLDIWKDGKIVPQFSQKKGKNTYDVWGNYMKIGIYKWWNEQNRNASLVTERTMFHDEVRIADQSGSYAAVAPPARIRRNSMAYTFEELLANPLPYDPDTEYLTVVTTVVVTQEDGRTGFVQDALVFEPTGKRLEKGTYNSDSADDCFIYFSDRGRFGGRPDSMGIEITQGTNGACNVLFTLKSWGSAQDRLSVALPQDYATTGKIYMGRGPTIGQGTGQALVCISFTTMEKHTIVMR